jgi:hypothetical protein
MMLFGIGDLVWFNDLDGQVYLSVVLADGKCGYGSDTRVIYIIYSIETRNTILAYESELVTLAEKGQMS